MLPSVTSPSRDASPTRDSRDEAHQLAWLVEAKPEAFHRFYQSWFPRIFSFAATRLSDPAHAESATRAALEAALRSLPARPSGDPAPWLLGLVKAEIARLEQPAR